MKNSFLDKAKEYLKILYFLLAAASLITSWLIPFMQGKVLVSRWAIIMALFLGPMTIWLIKLIRFYRNPNRIYVGAMVMHLQTNEKLRVHNYLPFSFQTVKCLRNVGSPILCDVKFLKLCDPEDTPKTKKSRPRSSFWER